MFLEVENLQAGYGTEEVLHGVSLRVDEGEIVSILGANGAGKTTTLLTISGLVRASGGAVRFQGEDLHTLPSHEVVRRGLTQSPEGRRVFGVLTVLENLRLGAFTVGDKEKAEQTLDWIFDLFPKERKDQLAGTLSGGEQQMLAIGRALMGQPKLLLLDEPSLGLAPLLVKSIFETIRAINQSGVTILIVEQNARAALKLATRGYVLELGRVVMEDTAAHLLANPSIQEAYLGA
ncbi:MAG: ABC transporter ATP-binding protein [Bilophila wadsworthia]